jgi:hypothetical protein
MKQLENGDANVLIGRHYDTSRSHSNICRGDQCPIRLKTLDLTTLGFPSNAEMLQDIRFAPSRVVPQPRSSRAASGSSTSGSHLRRPTLAATATASRKYRPYSSLQPQPPPALPPTAHFTPFPFTSACPGISPCACATGSRSSILARR